MTLHPRDLSQMPSDTAEMGRALLAENDPYRVIGEHLADILKDEDFAEMYDDTGRAAVSPGLLALITIFQFQEKVPDREAARMVVLRLDWKYALHLPLLYAGFHYSDLCQFRKRILEHNKEALVFDQILDKVKALGFIKRRGKQRTDSIAVMGAVRQLSVLEAVTESLRLALGAIEGKDLGWAEREIPASFREQYVRRRTDYRLTEEERKAALGEAGQDAWWLLTQIGRAGTEEVQGLEAVGVLRQIWEQWFARVSGESKVRVREKTVGYKELIVTPHDAGVRVGEKRGQQWRGEKVHVTETAEKGGPNFITDVTTSNAASGDGEALEEIRGKLAAREVTPRSQNVDAAYISGKHMAESEAAGIELIGPPLSDTSPQEFKIADFVVDQEAKKATCPAGHTSVKWTERRERDGSKAVNVWFAAQDCAACPLRQKCTSSKSGRSLHISEHYERLQARRAEAKTEAYKEKTNPRAAIEGTLSELVRKHGFRRHRYRGEAKRHMENLLKAAACNLKRLVRALVGRREKERAARTRLGGGTLAVSVP
jgi:transposase